MGIEVAEQKNVTTAKVSEKFCLGCKCIKLGRDFHNDPRASSGLQSRCKECYRKWFQTNRDRLREKIKANSVDNDSPKRASKKFYEKVKRSLWARFRRGRYKAIREGYGWTLSLDDFHRLSEKPCEYCGLAFDRGTGSGLDRVESDKGYVATNVVPCCATCNRVKLNVFTREDMKKLGPVLREIYLAHISQHSKDIK